MEVGPTHALAYLALPCMHMHIVAQALQRRAIADRQDMADNVYMAKLAEQAERYEEMVEYMKAVAQASQSDLTLEERNLLSVAYKNVVGARRASLRIIGSIETKEASKDGNNLDMIKSYKVKVEEELNTICSDILGLLDNSLIRSSLPAEPSVFYLRSGWWQTLAATGPHAFCKWRIARFLQRTAAPGRQYKMGSGLLPPLRIIGGGRGRKWYGRPIADALVSIGHQEDEG